MVCVSVFVHDTLLKFMCLQPPSLSLKHQTQLHYLLHPSLESILSSSRVSSPSNDKTPEKDTPFPSSPLFLIHLQRFLSLLPLLPTSFYSIILTLPSPPSIKSNLVSLRGQTAGMDRWLWRGKVRWQQKRRERERGESRVRKDKNGEV